MQMRGMAPGNNQSLWRKPPLLQKSAGFKTPPAPPWLCPASKSGVSGDTDASSSFASSAASCVMLLSGSRWRRRSRPGQVTRESAQSASCSACQWRNRATAAASERAHDQMRSIAVPGGPQRDAHCRLRHSAPYHHRCRNRLTGRGAAASGV
ncbi:Uncharacterised protein [Escherichia coli]|uniref:Uncharacterized protein n=1 Tax=Escherichia coli TaxID=562 RepID=A0A484X1L7_ECOLX|nr:Uncharacterised protein [Escherichia coli]